MIVGVDDDVSWSPSVKDVEQDAPVRLGNVRVLDRHMRCMPLLIWFTQVARLTRPGFILIGQRIRTRSCMSGLTGHVNGTFRRPSCAATRPYGSASHMPPGAGDGLLAAPPDTGLRRWHSVPMSNRETAHNTPPRERCHVRLRLVRVQAGPMRGCGEWS